MTPDRGSALLEAVAARYAVTAAELSSWPNPHPGDTRPREEEYSRCLDPGRYLVVAARARAWVEVLTEAGLAVAREDEGPVHGESAADEFERTVRLAPVRPGAVPLAFAYRSIDAVPDAVVAVAPGDPATVSIRLPQCGCDACDQGSEALLDEFDDHVLAVVSGAFTRVSTRKGSVVATGSGWTASGRFGADQVERLLSDARQGRRKHDVVIGGPWW